MQTPTSPFFCSPFVPARAGMLPALSTDSRDLPFDFNAPDNAEIQEGSEQSCWFTQARPPALPPIGDSARPTGIDRTSSWPVPGRDVQEHCLEVFDRDEIERYAATYRKQVADRDRRDVIAHLISHLRQSGTYRVLPRVPVDWRRRIDDLEQLFPNFSLYFSFLRTTYALAERERVPVHCEPVILTGPPGVGKSLVAQQVARQLMEVSCHTLRMETATASGDLVGIAEFWGNSKAGRLAQALIFGREAAPLFVLEELEKTTAREYDPLASLYALLEADSAKVFHDEAHPWMTINASRVMYLALCNSVDALPAPIVSRMKIIEIPAPTPEQAVTIANVLWRRLQEEWPVATSGLALADDALQVAAAYPPRLIRKGLREAVGRAVYQGHRVITADDIAACIGHSRKKRRCGFV